MILGLPEIKIKIRTSGLKLESFRKIWGIWKIGCGGKFKLKVFGVHYYSLGSSKKKPIKKFRNW